MPKRPRPDAADGDVIAGDAHRARRDTPAKAKPFVAAAAADSDEEDELNAELVAAGLLPPGAVYGDDDAVAAGAGAGEGRAINNIPALKAGLATVRADLPWLERLDVVSAESMGAMAAVDDLKIEMGL
jgi:hypothetical protein